MKEITRANAPTKFGGDLWNDAKLARIVFKNFPECQSFKIMVRVSGLYVRVMLDNGDEYMVFDSGGMRYERPLRPLTNPGKEFFEMARMTVEVKAQEKYDQ